MWNCVSLSIYLTSQLTGLFLRFFAVVCLTKKCGHIYCCSVNFCRLNPVILIEIHSFGERSPYADGWVGHKFTALTNRKLLGFKVHLSVSAASYITIELDNGPFLPTKFCKCDLTLVIHQYLPISIYRMNEWIWTPYSVKTLLLLYIVVRFDFFSFGV